MNWNKIIEQCLRDVHRGMHRNFSKLKLELVSPLDIGPAWVTTLKDNQKMCVRQVLLGKLAAQRLACGQLAAMVARCDILSIFKPHNVWGDEFLKESNHTPNYTPSYLSKLPLLGSEDWPFFRDGLIPLASPEGKSPTCEGNTIKRNFQEKNIDIQR